MLILYTTLGCHLCETAKDTLWPLVSQYQLTLMEVDIAEDDQLLIHYGERIPLIRYGDHDIAMQIGELAWPFDTKSAEVYLQRCWSLDKHHR